MSDFRLLSVLDAVGELAEASSRDGLVDAALSLARLAVGADGGLATLVQPSGSVTRCWPDEFFPPSSQRLFEQLHRRDPWPLTDHTRAGSGEPRRASDLLDRRHYRGTAWWSELFRHLEVDQQAAFSVPVGADESLCIALSRHGPRDFSPDDVAALAAVRRHVATSAARLARLDHFAAGDPGGLTRREREVVGLVAGGLTNDQIARHLGITARTVGKHLEHAFAKIGAANRTEAAEWHRLVGVSPDQRNRSSW